MTEISDIAGLLDQLREREAAFHALPEDDDAGRHVAMDRTNDVCQRIAEVRGATAGEVAIQFRVWRDREEWFPDKARDALWASVMEALDRLAARTGADDTKLLALVAEWREANDEAKRLFKEQAVVEKAIGDDDPDSQRRAVNADGVVIALAKRIINDIPAQTIAGLAAKLEIAVVETGGLADRPDEWDDPGRSLWSCWQDAKRLATP